MSDMNLLKELQEDVQAGKARLGTEEKDIAEELLKDRSADKSLR